MARRKKIALAASLAVAVVAVFLLAGYALRALYPYRYQEDIERIAQNFGLDPFLVAAIIRTESAFKPGAVSPAGACGLMQLMPSTAQWIAEKNGYEYDNSLLFDAAYNIELGCVYYLYLQNRFETRDEVLAAWNAGEGTVRKWIENGTMGKSIPYGETRRFVEKVNDAYEKYSWIYN